MANDDRIKQVVSGSAIIAGVAGLILLIAYGRHLPGVGGEFFGRILGIISTPFLMEASFLILGFVLVMSLNLWRQRREGDELVYLDETGTAPKADAREEVRTPARDIDGPGPAQS
jgi:hypothetical protein